MNPIAISQGDPAGIGPELIAASWILRGMARLEPFVAVGSRRVLDEAARHRGLDVPVRPWAAWPKRWRRSIRPAGARPGRCGLYPGQPTDRAPCSRSMRSTRHAAYRGGETSALVTAPVSKSRLASVGFNHPGQTEFVGQASGVAPEDAVMMLAGPRSRSCR
jgi:4-hydroxythreonine-4-phosphate dehydrogenase